MREREKWYELYCPECGEVALHAWLYPLIWLLVGGLITLLLLGLLGG